MPGMQIDLNTQERTHAHAAALARALTEPCAITLQGPLGSGKTTWTRAFLQALGHQGTVPSPTYTLVEPYKVGDFQIYHVDLYRLQSTLELEELGLREMLDGGVVLLVEWPERWPGLETLADVGLCFSHGEQAQARRLQVQSLSARGEALLREVTFS